MKIFVVFSLLITVAFCEVNIPEKFLNAQSAAVFYGFNNTDSIDVERHILGGFQAIRGEIPYAALLFPYSNDGFTVFQCGGTLIKHDFILTGSACLTLNYILAYLGIVERDMNSIDLATAHSPYAEWESEPLPPSAYYRHPNYNPTTFASNIGLLKIPLTQATLNTLRFVATVKLPTWNDENNKFVGRSGRASGFGLVNNFELSQYLRKIDLEVISIEDCKKTDVGAQTGINDSNLCTKNSGQSTVCNGDAGAPFTLNTNGDNRVVGIVAFTVTPCVSSYPGHFIRVASHLNWIASITGDELIQQGIAPASIKLSFLLAVLAVFIAFIK